MIKINSHDNEYHKLLEKLLKESEERPDRTNTGILSSFGNKMEFDVSTSIPLLTTKKISFKNILHETIWMFCQGSTNIKYLKDNGVNIWNNWANENGDLGPIYGYQARRYPGIRVDSHNKTTSYVDQIERLITNLKDNPYSRRHVITLWNPMTVPEDSNNFDQLIKDGYSALPVCHGVVIQFYVESEGRLSLQVYTRSNDVFLGLPYNLINYTLLLYMIAKVVDLKPYKLHYVIGDAHIYLNHLTQVKEQLGRNSFEAPQLILKEVKNFDDFTFDDFKLINYQSHPAIKGSVSV